MKKITGDILDAVLDLNEILESLTVNEWKSPTAFKEWTPAEVVAHLFYFDRMTVYSVNSPDKFKEEASYMFKTFSALPNSLDRAVAVKQRLGANDSESLRQQWHDSALDMCSIFQVTDPARRCTWFGPDMGARMFMTARFMETWSHSQAIYDLIGKERVYKDNIKNIATIGVKTFGWTYMNRKLEVPNQIPFISLSSPSGIQWQWNEPSTEESIKGLASDFCHVVTQTRNIDDTDLQLVGAVAKQWMAMAQCFAGDPEDPPAKGVRTKQKRG